MASVDRAQPRRDRVRDARREPRGPRLDVPKDTRRQIVRQAREMLLPFATALFEHTGGVFELLVLEKPLDELPPRVI